MEPQLPADSLFYGSAVVSLTPVPGSTQQFEEGCTWGDLAPPPSQSSPWDGHNNPRSRLGSLNTTNYEHLRLPAVPAVDIAGDLIPLEPKDTTHSRNILGIGPLLKTPAGPVFAVRSGEDSALTYLGGEWYRMKGCGHNTEGFPLEDIFPETRKVQPQQKMCGCEFDHTSKRDLHMTEVVNALLEEHGLIGGNTSIGRWVYNVPTTALTQAPLPAVTKHCNLFKTVGDKRLSTDVLQGLERLLPIFCPGAKHTDLIKHFPKERLDALKPGGVQRTFEWIFDHDRMLGSGLEPSNSGLVNLCHVTLPERVPSACPEEVLSRHRATWASSQQRMESFLSHEARDGDMLAHVVWRLGREAGKIRRILSDTGISWGFYYDHNPSEPVNMSHPDNFVLLKEGKHSQQLLAPVNFDKAYTADSFMLGTARDEQSNRWPTEEDLGMQDKDKFERWLNREHYALEMALGGDKGLANSDYGIEMDIDSHVAALLMTGLTDTCVLGYRSGFNQEEDAFPMDEELEEHVYDLLKMALCLSDRQHQTLNSDDCS